MEFSTYLVYRNLIYFIGGEPFEAVYPYKKINDSCGLDCPLFSVRHVKDTNGGPPSLDEYRAQLGCADVSIRLEVE